MDTPLTTDSKNYSPTAADVAHRVSFLPHCIIEQACGMPVNNLAYAFTYDTFGKHFGERLVRIAGLAIAAIYIKERVNRASFSVATLNEFICNSLYRSGYDLGLACSIVQKAGLLKTSPFDSIVPDDRPVMRFIESIPDRPSNRMRRELNRSVTEDLYELLEHLGFLCSFSFHEDKTVYYNGEIINMFPFLIWDGVVLYQFRQLASVSSSNRQITAINQWSPDERSIFSVSSNQRNQLDTIAQLLGRGFNGTPTIENEVTPMSIMPQLADTHPQVNRLAHLLWQKAEPETIIRLWLPPIYRDTPSLGRQFINQKNNQDAEILVTNTIIKKCLDEDPVSVMEKYFTYEPTDIIEYITMLSCNNDMAEKVTLSIEQRISNYRQMLLSFYYHLNEYEFDKIIDKYKARIAAQYIVKLMGFSIQEVVAEDEITSYQERVRAFLMFLQTQSEKPRWHDIESGIMRCAVTAEKILRFLYTFYRTLPFYDPTQTSGIMTGHNTAIANIIMETERSGLNELIDRFFGLKKNKEIRNATIYWLDRDSIWPEGTEEQIKLGLKRLNSIRIPLAHEKPLGPNDFYEINEAINAFVAFLDWLHRPLGNQEQREYGDQSPYRIYPVIVTLHLMTVTRSGITSMRYLLRELSNAEPEIRLYTEQPVSVKHCYYGLPHSKKISKELWVNPLLIQTEIVTGRADDRWMNDDIEK